MKKRNWIISTLFLLVITAAAYYINYNSLANKQLRYFESLKDTKALAKPNCEKVIMIDKAAITDYAAWEAQDSNKDCIVTYTCSFTPCSANVILYDIEKYFDKYPDDVTKVGFSQWLQRNGKYICSNASYENIEKAHIADEKLSGLIMDEDIDTIVKFKDIKAVINKTDSNCYNNDRYNNYIRFYFDKNKHFKMELSPTFRPVGGYYSIQLLKSIEYRRNNNAGTADDIGSETEFEFRYVPIANYKRRVVFSVKTGKNEYEADFYDYSQIPPKSLTRVNMYGFSPL